MNADSTHAGGFSGSKGVGQHRVWHLNIYILCYLRDCDSRSGRMREDLGHGTQGRYANESRLPAVLGYVHQLMHKRRASKDRRKGSKVLTYRPPMLLDTARLPISVHTGGLSWILAKSALKLRLRASEHTAYRSKELLTVVRRR